MNGKRVCLDCGAAFPVLTDPPHLRPPWLTAPKDRGVLSSAHGPVPFIELSGIEKEYLRKQGIRWEED